MRNISFLFLLTILSCQGSKPSKSKQANIQSTNKDVASTVSVGKNLSYKPISAFNGDTLQYLNYNFVEHKEQYIGKTFSVLYNDLEIPVKSCLGGPDRTNGFASSSLSLHFVDDNTRSYRMNNDNLPSYFIIIKWEKPLSTEAMFQLDMANDQKWTSSHEAFVANEIIKDIAVLKYIDPQSTKK